MGTAIGWSGPYERLRYTILAAQREGDRRLTEALRDVGLTTSQAEVLRVLEDQEPMTLRELGEHLICERGSPSRLVKTLTAAQIVAVSTVETDGRAMRLTLTARGNRLAARVKAVEHEFYSALGRGLSTQQADEISSLLCHLIGNSDGARALSRRASIEGGILDSM